MKRSPDSGSVVIFGLLLGLVGAGVLRFFSGASAPVPELRTQQLENDASTSAASEPRLPPAPVLDTSPRPLTQAADGAARPPKAVVPVRSSESDSDEAGHPHAISARHRRIFEENNRLGAMDGAMDQGDFAALRGMNARYRRDYPEDDHDLQQGYDLIADCLEERTPQAIAVARRFWQTHRASALRRHVRRHCLEENAENGAVARHAQQ